MEQASPPPSRAKSGKTTFRRGGKVWLMTVVLVIVPLGGLLLLLYGAGRLAIASGARLPWTPRRSGRHFETVRSRLPKSEVIRSGARDELRGQDSPLTPINQAEALMNSPIKGLVMLVTVIALGGCASPMQWWRVGNCVVIYDTREESRQILVAGQQCDIKRAELPNVYGSTR